MDSGCPGERGHLRVYYECLRETCESVRLKIKIFNCGICDVRCLPQTRKPCMALRKKAAQKWK